MLPTREEYERLLSVGEFQRTGVTSSWNYYRNVDRNWALTPFYDGAKLQQRTLFIAGDRDGVLGFWGEEVEAPGGRERTEAELGELLREAGFALTRMLPTRLTSIIEGRPV